MSAIILQSATQLEAQAEVARRHSGTFRRNSSVRSLSKGGSGLIATMTEGRANKQPWFIGRTVRVMGKVSLPCDK
jgi:hypothetical protein